MIIGGAVAVTYLCINDSTGIGVLDNVFIPTALKMMEQGSQQLITAFA